MSTSNSPRQSLLITGATGGMGRAAALLAAREGTPLILADLSTERLDELCSQCAGLGAQARAVRVDVTDQGTIQALLDSLPAEASLSGIIHTVGLSPQMADWRRIIDVDLVSTIALLEKLRSHLVPGGGVVCISSMSAYMAPPDEEVDALMATPQAEDFMAQLERAAERQPLLKESGMAYSWSKKALKDWVARAAGDWGSEGKRLTSISPGLIDTDQGKLESAAMSKEQLSHMQGLVALGRLGVAEDIAQTALFLISPRASYITGCDLLVDGGFIANFQQGQQVRST